jgi:predicted NAD/FAD-binding protein
MLTVQNSPVWRTVVGGSRQYVEAAAKELSAVRTATPVRSVHRLGRGVAVRDDADALAEFDAVVLATHADQALRLLADPDPAQREVLGAFGYSRNETVLHGDERVLPRHRAARSSWNYLLPACQPEPGAIQVSYDMNRLQRAGHHLAAAGHAQRYAAGPAGAGDRQDGVRAPGVYPERARGPTTAA